MVITSSSMVGRPEERLIWTSSSSTSISHSSTRCSICGPTRCHMTSASSPLDKPHATTLPNYMIKCNGILHGGYRKHVHVKYLPFHQQQNYIATYMLDCASDLEADMQSGTCLLMARAIGTHYDSGHLSCAESKVRSKHDPDLYFRPGEGLCRPMRSTQRTFLLLS